MIDTASSAPAAPSRKKLLIGSAAALGVAAVALVVFVLPAEFGIDPTGAGEALGLTELSQPGMNEEQIRGARREGVLTLSEQPLQRDWADRWEHTLAPYEGIELKYTLNEGDVVDFSWQAAVPLYHDMHSHPFEGGVELTETYSLGEAAGMQGRYVAAFTGLHGWYWQNRTLDPVTITVQAAGPLTESTLFEQGVARPRPITPAE